MADTKTVPRNLTSRELAIIISALRLEQNNPKGINAMPQMHDSPKAVTPEEIDELCVYLNLGECSRPVAIQFHHRGARS